MPLCVAAPLIEIWHAMSNASVHTPSSRAKERKGNRIMRGQAYDGYSVLRPMQYQLLDCITAPSPPKGLIVSWASIPFRPVHAAASRQLQQEEQVNT